MKKKIFFAFTLLFAVFLLPACNAPDVSDFVSFDHNTILTFEIEDMAGETRIIWQTFPTYAGNNQTQRRSRILYDFQGFGTGVVMNEVLELRGDDLVMTHANQNLPENISMLDWPPAIYTVILQGPIELGHSWAETPWDFDGAHREITGVGISVVTLAGTFETIEVTTTSPLGEGQLTPRINRQYFAKGIGMVKEISYSDTTEPEQEPTVLITRLVSIEAVGGLLEPFDFHLRGNTFNAMMNYTTNNDLTDIYTAALHEGFAHFGVSIRPQGRVEALFFNADSRNLIVDISTELFEDIGHDETLFFALIDSFGGRFHAMGVHITVEGEPFGGVIGLSPLQFITPVVGGR